MVGECDGLNVLGDGTLGCWAARAGGTGTKLCGAVGRKQCKPNEGPSLQGPQGTPGAGGPMCRDSLGGKILHDASRVPTVCRMRD